MAEDSKQPEVEWSEQRAALLLQALERLDALVAGPGSGERRTTRQRRDREVAE